MRPLTRRCLQCSLSRHFCVFLLLIFFLLSTQALIVTPRSCTACCKVWPPREAKKLHRVLVSSFREERRSSRSGPCSLAPRCPRTIKTIQTERRRGRSAYHILVALATIKYFIGKISRRTIVCGLFFFSFLFFNFLIFFFFFFFAHTQVYRWESVHGVV